ncbi:hypothetical protein DIPPA_33203 [Diplonema papillatum]|nr:hypothetical protein DIPPA_33203 [Diplonema papillatum]
MSAHDLAAMMKQREEELRRAAEQSRVRAQAHRQQALAAHEVVASLVGGGQFATVVDPVDLASQPSSTSIQQPAADPQPLLNEEASATAECVICQDQAAHTKKKLPPPPVAEPPASEGDHGLSLSPDTATDNNKIIITNSSCHSNNDGKNNATDNGDDDTSMRPPDEEAAVPRNLRSPREPATAGSSKSKKRSTSARAGDGASGKQKRSASSGKPGTARRASTPAGGAAGHAFRRSATSRPTSPGVGKGPRAGGLSQGINHGDWLRAKREALREMKHEKEKERGIEREREQLSRRKPIGEGKRTERTDRTAAKRDAATSALGSPRVRSRDDHCMLDNASSAPYDRGSEASSERLRPWEMGGYPAPTDDEVTRKKQARLPGNTSPRSPPHRRKSNASVISEGRCPTSGYRFPQTASSYVAHADTYDASFDRTAPIGQKMVERLEAMEKSASLKDTSELTRRHEEDARLRRLEEDNSLLREQLTALLTTHPLIAGAVDDHAGTELDAGMNASFAVMSSVYDAAEQAALNPSFRSAFEANSPVFQLPTAASFSMHPQVSGPAGAASAVPPSYRSRPLPATPHQTPMIPAADSTVPSRRASVAQDVGHPFLVNPPATAMSLSSPQASKHDKLRLKSSFAATPVFGSQEKPKKKTRAPDEPAGTTSPRRRGQPTARAIRKPLGSPPDLRQFALNASRHVTSPVFPGNAPGAPPVFESGCGDMLNANPDYLEPGAASSSAARPRPLPPPPPPMHYFACQNTAATPSPRGRGGGHYTPPRQPAADADHRVTQPAIPAQFVLAAIADLESQTRLQFEVTAAFTLKGIRAVARETMYRLRCFEADTANAETSLSVLERRVFDMMQVNYGHSDYQTSFNPDAPGAAGAQDSVLPVASPAAGNILLAAASPATDNIFLAAASPPTAMAPQAGGGGALVSVLSHGSPAGKPKKKVSVSQEAVRAGDAKSGRPDAASTAPPFRNMSMSPVRETGSPYEQSTARFRRSPPLDASPGPRKQALFAVHSPISMGSPSSWDERTELIRRMRETEEAELEVEEQNSRLRAELERVRHKLHGQHALPFMGVPIPGVEDDTRSSRAR